LFARPLTEDGVYREEDDIVEAWCLDGYVFFILVVQPVKIHEKCRNDFLAKDDLADLKNVRDLFLGPANEMTSKPPTPDPLNPENLIGGTAFERCGQRAVKDSGRCYSLTMTHQRQKALVGPTSSGKFYDIDGDADDKYSLNLRIRGKVTEVRKIFSDLLILY
jgi:hypothetical protein